MRFAERDQFARRVGGQASSAKSLRKVADGGVNDGAALGGARLGVDRIERAQAQNVLRVDRIGIAQPILDLGHRKALGRAARGGVGAGCDAGVTRSGRSSSRAQAR